MEKVEKGNDLWTKMKEHCEMSDEETDVLAVFPTLGIVNLRENPICTANVCVDSQGAHRLCSGDTLENKFSRSYCMYPEYIHKDTISPLHVN